MRVTPIPRAMVALGWMRALCLDWRGLELPAARRMSSIRDAASLSIIGGCILIAIW
jgi:hypothetical protein